jgi:hypothetical protein
MHPEFDRETGEPLSMEALQERSDQLDEEIEAGFLAADVALYAEELG